MIQHRIVIHFLDGRLMKGITNDFFPDKSLFHLVSADAPVGSKPLEIKVPELKAIFFVKEFAGNPEYNDKKEFDPVKTVIGRKIKIIFNDGELMIGATQGYQPDRTGFFVIPTDPLSNIERCFVIKSATQHVSFI